MPNSATQKVKLNKNQLKAVEHEKGPLLVVAGAGTGKTRVITERIKFLIEKKNVKPEEILALTFTDKASQEMVERVGDIMPLGYSEPWIYTFHSFADRLLKKEGIEIGLDPGYKVLSSPEQWLLLRQNIFKLNLEYFRPMGNPTKFISDVLKFISRLQDEYITAEDFTAYVEKKSDYETSEEKQRWTELSYLYSEYQRLKIEKSRLDFGDLIMWTLHLFDKRKNILEKYRRQFKHILVDEFQDTNYAQYILIKKLFQSEETARSLIVVGDDSQSIYKFRGAAVSNILEFMQDYKTAEMVTLLENYRSTQKILDPAYKIIQNNNPDTLESKLNISKKLVSMVEKQDNNPQIITTDNLEDEVTFVISKILEILALEPQYTYKDFAILARANSHLDPFLLGLRQHGIPYQLVGNKGLYDRDEIRDVIALLKIIINPNDPINVYRVLNISPLNISYSEITKLLSAAKTQKEDLWSSVKKSKDENVIALIATIDNYQKQITKFTPVEFVFNLISEIGYINQFTKEETIENQLAVKNLDIFLNIVKRFEVSFHQENKEYPTIVDLVTYLELMLEAGDNPAQAEIEDIDTVNLMTTHAAKGLEFSVVFVINTVSDRFPTRNRSDTLTIPDDLIKETLPTGDEHIQEERRLFYVAMTRAKKYLFMTLAKNYGGKRDKTPSGFLSETGLPIEKYTPGDISGENTGEGNTNTLFGKNSGYREPKAEKITDFTPSFLSYSQIDTYLTCGLQYKYRYILKIPTLPNHALSFGTTVHDTLRDFHTKLMLKKPVDFDDVKNMYETNWQPLGYMDAEHRKTRFEKGIELLKKYYDKHKDKKYEYIDLEKPFNVRIGGIRFYGRIDRIDHIPGEDAKNVEIIDYKTGNAKTQKEVDKDMQVAIYAIAAKEALGYEPKLLSLYYLDSEQKVTTTRSDEDIAKTKDKIVETIKQIKSGDFEARPGLHCGWCDYKDICPSAFKG